MAYNMIEKLSPEKFLMQMSDAAVIDVRSPAEFASGHIPGSFNIPLFENEERAEIGTIYKNKGKQHAVERGLEIVGPKMAGFVRQARKIAQSRKVLMYCWRGGMRSGSMAWLLETAGIPVTLLQDGYKGFRQYGKNALTFPAQLIVIGGFTGSGKTRVLKAIEQKGEQVLDIEELARHRGSSFGAIGREFQKTNEQFENDLILKWLSFDHNRIIWVEDESRILGSNHIPEEIYARIRESCVYKLEIPKSERVKNLVDDYSVYDPHQLEAAVLRIQSKLGGLATREALNALEEGNFARVASISLDYYDKTYNFGLSKRSPESITSFDFEVFNPDEIAETLIRYAKKFVI